MKKVKSVLQVVVKCYFSGRCCFKQVCSYALFRNDRSFLKQKDRISGQRWAALCSVLGYTGRAERV